MITLGDVRRWDPAQVEAALTGFGALRDGLATAEYDFGRARVPDDWTGIAAGGARASQSTADETAIHINDKGDGRMTISASGICVKPDQAPGDR